jgi:hypothetical protein
MSASMGRGGGAVIDLRQSPRRVAQMPFDAHRALHQVVTARRSAIWLGQIQRHPVFLDIMSNGGSPFQSHVARHPISHVAQIAG